MKTISLSSTRYLLGLLSLLALAPSCKRYQELPEVGREDIASRVYRLEESKPMSDEDVAALKKIQDEYKQNAQ